MSGRTEYEEVSPDICDVCGHEVFEEDGCCLYCGEPVQKIRRPKKQAEKQKGGTAVLVILIIVVIWFLIKK